MATNVYDYGTTTSCATNTNRNIGNHTNNVAAMQSKNFIVQRNETSMLIASPTTRQQERKC